jgi:hypothetical protein
MEKVRLYQSKLIQCQSDHGDYTCSRGGVAKLGDDAIDFNTRVSIVRCAWVQVVTSYHA